MSSTENTEPKVEETKVDETKPTETTEVWIAFYSTARILYQIVLSRTETGAISNCGACCRLV